MDRAGGKNFEKFCWLFYTAKWLHLAVRLAVVTIKGALVKGFSCFLKTLNKGKGGSVLLDKKNKLRQSIPSVPGTQ